MFSCHQTLPARIVLDVQQEGSARKLIVVRSALMLINKLDSAVELKLENSIEKGELSQTYNTEDPFVDVKS